MGMVSFLEDITDRLTDDLGHMLGALDTPADSEVETHKLRGMMREVEAHLRKLHSYLDYATDPQLDLAARVHELEDDKRRVQHRLVASEANITRLKETIAARDARIDALKQDVHTLKKERAKLEAKFETLLNKNPRAAYELYS
jgi:chromosome segregation ATPase